MLAKNEDNPDSCSTSLAKELFFLLSEALAATLVCDGCVILHAMGGGGWGVVCNHLYFQENWKGG